MVYSVFQEADEEEDFELPPGTVEMNRTGIIPFLTFSVIWAFGAGGVLFLLVYFYAYGEVLKQENLAVKVAASKGRHAAALALNPAVHVAAAVQTALSVGTYAGMSDYAGLMTLLTPHFAAQPLLREVQLAIQQDPGSVLVTLSEATAQSSLSRSFDYTPVELVIQTDRSDCTSVPGGRGCTTQPFFASMQDWYINGFGIGSRVDFVPPTSFWVGPNFLRSHRYDVTCSSLCWLPGYSSVGKVQVKPLPLVVPGCGPGCAATAPGNNTQATPSMPAILVRAALDAVLLQPAIATVESISRGEACIATVNGEVIAARDMAKVQTVDHSTGQVRATLAWEFARPWASALTQQFVNKADSGNTVLTTGGYRVSAWPIAGTTTGTDLLAQNLRVIIAVPGNAFMDPVLGQLVMAGLVVALSPFALLGLFMIISIYLRFCRSSRPPDEEADNESESQMASSASSWMGNLMRSSTLSKFSQASRMFSHSEHGYDADESEAESPSGSPARRLSLVLSRVLGNGSRRYSTDEGEQEHGRRTSILRAFGSRRSSTDEGAQSPGKRNSFFGSWRSAASTGSHAAEDDADEDEAK